MITNINQFYSDILTLFFKPEILTSGMLFSKYDKTSEYAIVLVKFRDHIGEIFSM